MTAINATPMATVHVGLAQDAPPSPTLSNPDLILPSSGTPPSPTPLASSPTLRQPELFLPASPTTASLGRPSRQEPDAPAELGVATAIRMPIRIKPSPPTTLLPIYSGYEHGAPLSDIGEEDMTPRSRRSRRSPSPPRIEPPSPTPQSKTQRHKQRLSDNSSSAGSDVGDWENFDTSKMMTGRLAADVAREDDEDEAPESKRNSVITLNNEDRDEMAILNAKAEKILANARKRLTHMEDNLTKARHSVYLGDRVLANMRSSPNMSELHQPAGGLYRSISLASRKSKPLYPVAKTNPQIHARGLSDTTTSSGLKRLSMIPEARSSSAQEYNNRIDSPQNTLQTRFSPSMKYHGHSPASSRSVNSPMRTLEEEQESPSTVKTSPESNMPRGLGINTLANETKEDLSVLPVSSSPTSLVRSASAASSRSIREQMTDLRGRISDLQTKTRADKERRQNVQRRNTPSPFTNASNPEQWYTSAPEYKEGGSPYSANAGVGWSPVHEKRPSIDAHLTPITPQTAKFLETEPPTTAESARFDGRTDVNTPNLHQRTIALPREDADRADSVIQESLYEDAAQDFEEDEDPVAASEEEQIYLNEVLEESLQELEEPDVPDLSEHLIPADGEAERHEDRLDAFDYENMFLHSAMGNFANRSRSASETSDTSSVATKRAGQDTPTAGHREVEIGEGGDDETVLHSQEVEISGPTPAQGLVDEDTLPTPKSLAPPMKPWMKHPQRSQSVESVSTVATFATATEGGHAEDDGDDDDDDEEAPNEILAWGNGTAFPKPPLSSPKRETVGAWPTPPMSGRLLHQHGIAGPIRSPGGSVSQIPHLNMMTGNNFQSNGIPTPTQSPMASSAAAAQPMEDDRQESQTPTSSTDHPANTEILMESLIKLADPDFKVHGTGNTFADVDKDLVLSLLRAVGGVCDGVLKAEMKRESRDVKVLRRRLDLARRVLEGESGEE